MKRSMFAIFAAFALLLSAPLAAQDETVQPYESRTNPDAGSITGDSGLTITGEVVEWNDEQLVLETATGTEHIQIVPNTRWGMELTEGEEVSVDYTRTSQGVMIASQIRTSGELLEERETDTVTATTTSSLTTDTDVDTTADLDVEADADADWNDGTMEAETDVTADFDADTNLDDQEYQADLDTEDEWDTNDELPATGSELPLLGLLGLLSLVAAVGVRTFR